MRIAIPLQQGRFSSHFGGAEAFAFYSVDMAQRSLGERRLEAPPQHGRGVFPAWLRQKGVTVVLAGGIGPRAIDFLNRCGIEVVLGVTGDDPDAMAQGYIDGTLVATGEVCHEHGFHDCGHDHAGNGRSGCHQG